MNLSIFLLFTMAYTIPRIIGRLRLLRIVASTNFTHLVVSMNIAIWSGVALWRMGVEMDFYPLAWKGVEAEFLTFSMAFAGLHLLRFATRVLHIEVKTADYPTVPVLKFVDIPLFGAMEEVIWRGYVLNALGGFWGYVISSAGFGFHHVGSSIGHFLWATVAGFVLGGAYLIFGGLWGVFLAHGLYNLTVLTGR